jgi:hypothetical protein
MLIQLGFGDAPQKETLKSIELLGGEVAPVVRKEIESLRQSEASAYTHTTGGAE